MSLSQKRKLLANSAERRIRQRLDEPSSAAKPNLDDFTRNLLSLPDGPLTTLLAGMKDSDFHRVCSLRLQRLTRICFSTPALRMRYQKYYFCIGLPNQMARFIPSLTGNQRNAFVRFLNGAFDPVEELDDPTIIHGDPYFMQITPLTNPTISSTALFHARRKGVVNVTHSECQDTPTKRFILFAFNSAKSHQLNVRVVYENALRCPIFFEVYHPQPQFRAQHQNLHADVTSLVNSGFFTDYPKPDDQGRYMVLPHRTTDEDTMQDFDCDLPFDEKIYRSTNIELLPRLLDNIYQLVQEMSNNSNEGWVYDSDFDYESSDKENVGYDSDMLDENDSDIDEEII